MQRIPGDVVRRVLAVSAVVALASVSACGGGTTGEAGGSSPSPSPSPSSSSTTGEAGAGEPGAAADGKCGGGEFETKVVQAAQGVQLTVPAAWEVQTAKGGAQIGFYPPDRDVGDGYAVVKNEDQTLDEAVVDGLKFTAESAKTTSEQDLDLAGFGGARMVTFEYDDGAFSVDVVAVFGGQRLRANMSREGVPEEQAVAESCLSTLTRTQ